MSVCKFKFKMKKIQIETVTVVPQADNALKIKYKQQIN